MRYFIFMDESGNNAEDKYFALWFLFVPDYRVGYLYDDMLSFYDRAKEIAKNIKSVKIQEFIDNQRFVDLKKILSTQSNFELKFKNINFTNKDIYKWMIDKICWYNDIQYSAFIVNKENQDISVSYRDNYIKYASLCIAENMENSNEYIFISDTITQPKWEREKWKEFENYVTESIVNNLKSQWKRTDNFFWALRIESHSSVLLQLTDTILWCIMYFLRSQQWIIWEKTKLKKWFVAETLKRKLWDIDFSESQRIEDPFVFSIKHYY